MSIVKYHKNYKPIDVTRRERQSGPAISRDNLELKKKKNAEVFKRQQRKEYESKMYRPKDVNCFWVISGRWLDPPIPWNTLNEW